MVYYRTTRPLYKPARALMVPVFFVNSLHKPFFTSYFFPHTLFLNFMAPMKLKIRRHRFLFSLSGKSSTWGKTEFTYWTGFFGVWIFWKFIKDFGMLYSGRFSLVKSAKFRPNSHKRPGLFQGSEKVCCNGFLSSSRGF